MRLRAILPVLTAKDRAQCMAAAGVGVAFVLAIRHLPPAGALLALIVTSAACAAGRALLATRYNARTAELTGLLAALDAVGRGSLGVSLPPVRALPHGQAINGTLAAMTQSIRAQMQLLSSRALEDPLTGLGNRSHLQRTVEGELRRADATSSHSLLYIDLDGFKQINDTLGHDRGDQLLKAAADRLRLAVETAQQRTGESDADGSVTPFVQLARIGGDEFVVFMTDDHAGTLGHRIAGRIVRVLTEPFQLDTHLATIGASVGGARHPVDGVVFRDLLNAADVAMYHAKKTGRGRSEFYRPELDRDLREAAEQEEQLREAITQGQLELHYQPLYDIRSGDICSAEALVRWRHPTRGLLPPSAFMPIIDRCHLTEQLGEWVLNDAVRTIATLRAAGIPLAIAINIPPLQIERADFTSQVRSCLRRWDVPADMLHIEVTEGAAMNEVDRAAERLGQLSGLGVGIAIDDFGTGFSNLARLIALPISRLKIDRSMVQDLTTRPAARVLVHTIISMANSLGLHSVAEGVETDEQLELLADMGCDIVQGFLLARPMPLDALQAALATEKQGAGVNQLLKAAG